MPLEVERVVMEAKGSLAMRFQRAILHRGGVVAEMDPSGGC
jgi:hypothetical protein